MFIENEEEELIKEIDEYGNIIYRNKERYYHRENGPSIICSNGSKYWHKNGQYHRLNGPAIECSGGSKYWFQNNKKHRLDGPAVIWSNGHKEYWIEGKSYSKEDYETKKNTCKPT